MPFGKANRSPSNPPISPTKPASCGLFHFVIPTVTSLPHDFTSRYILYLRHNRGNRMPRRYRFTVPTMISPFLTELEPRGARLFGGATN